VFLVDGKYLIKFNRKKVVEFVMSLGIMILRSNILFLWLVPVIAAAAVAIRVSDCFVHHDKLKGFNPLVHFINFCLLFWFWFFGG